MCLTFQESIYDIYKTLRRQFGAVEFEENSEDYIHVRIVDTDVVHLLKQYQQIVVNGRKLMIRFQGYGLSNDRTAKQIFPIDELLTKPPKPNAAANILNALNDDCMYAIFKHSHLNMEDIFALAKTCKHFNTLIDHVLTVNTLTKRQIVTDFIQLTLRSHRIGYIDDYLQHYGYFIERACTNTATYYDQIQLHLLTDHCKHIKDLTVVIDQSTFPHCWNQFDALFANNPNITKLTIRRSFAVDYFEVNFPTVAFKHLKSLSLNDLYVADRESFDTFCQLNNHITKLTLRNVDMSATAVRPLKHLRHVKMLYIKVKHENIVQYLETILATQMPLEALTALGSICWDDQAVFFYYLAQFQMLRYFEHDNPRYLIDFDLMIRSVKVLRRLRHLTLRTYRLEFDHIHILLIELPQLKTLKIRTSMNSEDVTEQFDIINMIHRLVSQPDGIKLTVVASMPAMETTLIEVSVEGFFCLYFHCLLR